MLEELFRATEGCVGRAASAAKAVMQGLHRVQSSLESGDLRRVRKALTDLEGTNQQLVESLKGMQDASSFDEEAYLSSPGFSQEIVSLAAERNIQVLAVDGALYSYPVTITPVSRDRAVLINGKRDSRLRPSVIVEAIAVAQKEPVRFKPQAFLESLHAAYKLLRARGTPTDSVLPLIKVYEVFTLLPEQWRKYTKQEFAQDVYLLDRSGVTQTKSGERVSFPASTGTRSIADTLATLSETGEERRYYGIAFEMAQETQTSVPTRMG